MKEQMKVKEWLDMGNGSGYNRTDVLTNEGGMMKAGRFYPEEWVKDMTMAAFEAVMVRLKAHAEPEVRELAQAADACFLLWQLAGEETVLATQTIGEWLPVVIGQTEDGRPGTEAAGRIEGVIGGRDDQEKD